MGPESVETITSDLGNHKTDTGQITDGLTGTTETLDKNFVVLVAEGHATVTGNEAGDSLIVFFELDSDTLSNTGVWLLGFDTNLLNDNAAGMGSATEWLSPFSGLMGKFVLLVSPKVQSSLILQLATSLDTTWFVRAHSKLLCEIRDLFINDNPFLPTSFKPLLSI